MNKKQQKMSKQPVPKVGCEKQKSFADLIKEKAAEKQETKSLGFYVDDVLTTAPWQHLSPYVPNYAQMQVVVYVPGGHNNTMFAVFPEVFQGLDTGELNTFLQQQVTKFQKEMLADLAKYKAELKVKAKYTPQQLETLTYEQYHAAVQDALFLAEHTPLYEAYKQGKEAVNWHHPYVGSAESEVVNLLAETFNGVKEEGVCPDCKFTRPLMDVIVHLNDKHKWSREAIADWLETLDIDITEKEHA